MSERRYFVTYNAGMGQTMHAILIDDGKMNWSGHKGWGTRKEIPAKYWGTPMREIIAFFDAPKPRVKIPHG